MDQTKRLEAGAAGRRQAMVKKAEKLHLRAMKISERLSISRKWNPRVSDRITETSV